MVDESQVVTKLQLEKMNKIHRKELRLIRQMSESQFQVFKFNFSFGHLNNITKAEAEELLISMLAINLNLQNDTEKLS